MRLVAASLLARVVVLIGLAVAIAATFAAVGRPPANLCEEGAEAPTYDEISVPGAGFPAYYRLLRVTDSLATVPLSPLVDVLFVPGNAGSYTQVKSFVAEAAKASIPLRFFTIDLGGEFSAFRGELLRRQAQFVRECMVVLQHPSGALRTGVRSPLLAVGHSMGGMVLRVALQRALADGATAAAPDDMLPLLLTLGTPHAAPVVATEASVSSVYRIANSQAGQRIRVSMAVSVSGGERDVQVPAYLCELPASVAGLQKTLAAQSIRGVRGSVDHQCLSWCLPMVHRLNELIMASGRGLAPEVQVWADLMWSAVDVADWPSATVWPVSVLAAQHSPSVVISGNASAGHSGVRLTLPNQWLALPQRLEFQCSGGGESRPPLLFVAPYGLQSVTCTGAPPRLFQVGHHERPIMCASLCIKPLCIGSPLCIFTMYILAGCKW
jgi:hypothetical protein